MKADDSGLVLSVNVVSVLQFRFYAALCGSAFVNAHNQWGMGYNRQPMLQGSMIVFPPTCPREGGLFASLATGIHDGKGAHTNNADLLKSHSVFAFLHLHHIPIQLR